MKRPRIKRTVPYGLLTNIRVILDAHGLETNTTNAYGAVDGSNVVTALTSITPGPTGVDFGVIGSGVTFDPTTKTIALNGSGRLRHTGASSVFNFMSYNAVYANQKHTVFWVGKLGTALMPNASYALWGNNAGSSANKGVAATYVNTAAESALGYFISKGNSGDYLGRVSVPGGSMSNQLCVIAMQFDGGGTSRVRLYVNDQALLLIEMQHNNSVPVTTPSYAMELGGIGNSLVPLTGNIAEFIVAEEATSFNNTIVVIRALMNKHNIVRSRADLLNKSFVTASFDGQPAGSGSYYYSAVVSQDPTNKYRIFAAYTKGITSGYGSGKLLAGRTSLVGDYAASNTFGSEATIYDPTNPGAVQECGGGFDNNGVMHLFTEVLVGSGAGQCTECRHLYSSNLTSWTNTDITSSLASDGLANWRMYGNLVHANGIWVKPYYKTTDQGSTTNTANYILRSTNGTTWTSVTVRASSTSNYNAGSVVYLGGDSWLILVQDDVSFEWRQFYSSDNALTWTDQGAVTFNETITSNATPPMLKKFTHNGSVVVVAYITNRTTDTAYSIYGLASNLISSGLTGWNLNTKFTWWKTSAASTSLKHYHYGDVTHIDDTIRAVGLYPYDPYPPTGAGVDNGIHFITMPTWHIAKIETELGL